MQPNQGALAAGLLGFVCLVLAIALVIVIFYFLTLQKALSRVSRRNRLMEPGMVWLGLIPIFNIIWSFFIATRVPDSLRNEFRDQDRDDGSDYGRGIGLANAILGVASIPFSVIAQLSPNSFIGLIQLPIGLASLVLFIMFWVKIAGYSSRLATSLRSRRDDRDYDDDEEDYREPGPRRDASDAIRPDDRDRFERQ